MNNIENMRNLIALINESKQLQVNPAFAISLINKISPTVRNAKDKTMEAGLGSTVAFIAVFLGGVETANIGPLDTNSAIKMKRQLTQDIQRSYDYSHPKGFTDGSGTIYRMQDWDINIETCHSSECNNIIGPRMDAIRASRSVIT